MKIVISTQFRENYGAHDWDGKGECPQYWKSKGGSTYVIPCGLGDAQNPSFWNAVEAAVQHRDDYSEEYVIGSDLLDDGDEIPCDPWETPTFLQRQSADKWLASRVIDNTSEYGYMRSEIARKQESYVLCRGEQSDHKNMIEFVDGTILPYKEACDYLAQMEAA